MFGTLLLASALALSAPADSLPLRSVVLWTPETYSTMRFLYERITAIPNGVEFAACLRAHREENHWIVSEVVIPVQSGNSHSGIESADCTGYEGVAHSHPLWQGQRFCYPSFADRQSLNASTNHFMVIWCDSEAFTFRTRDLGIGGKDDRRPERTVNSSPEPHLWRHPRSSAPASASRGGPGRTD